MAIDHTLVSGNEIVLTDEPTGNLDTENSPNIMKILPQLSLEEDRCVVIVTYDPAVAEVAASHLQEGWTIA